MDDSSPDTSPRRLPAGRRADLAAFVAEAGQVTVGMLAERFDVSIDTVRRDLDELDRLGAIIRTHGGAVSVQDQPRNDRDLDVRLRMQTAEKETIAALAAKLIPDGSVVMINAGTTALALARALHDHRELTIATNNLRIPTILSPKCFRDLYVFGGPVRTVTQATTGPVSFKMATGGDEVEIRCDIALIAVGAVSDSGYSTSNLADASMMNEMMQRASRTAILADSSKIGRRLFAQVAPLAAADYLVTDAPLPAELDSAMQAAGVQVIVPTAAEARAPRSSD